MSANAASTLSARQLEILRRLAEREAARRQASSVHVPAEAEAADAANTAFAAPAITADFEGVLPALPRDAALLDASRLETILREERQKNDVAWAKVREQEDLLSSRPPAESRQDSGTGGTADNESASLRAKELELAKLDHDIMRLTKNLPTLDPPQSDAILALLTRATLASAIDQYEGGVRALREDVSTQRRGLQEDDELQRDLDEVRIGMEKRREVLRKRGEGSDLASTEKKLLARLQKTESELSELLRNLIAITEKLFKTGQDVERAQLRHLIDRLINKAWDTPADPFVDVGDDYMPAVSAFLLRANVAVEHTRDAHRLRLIEFQKAAIG